MSRRRQQAGQHSIPHLRQTIDFYVVTSSVPTLNQASFIHFVATVERSGETFLSLIEGRVMSRPVVVSRPANTFCFVGVRKNSFWAARACACASPFVSLSVHEWYARRVWNCYPCDVLCAILYSPFKPSGDENEYSISEIQWITLWRSIQACRSCPCTIGFVLVWVSIERIYNHCNFVFVALLSPSQTIRVWTLNKCKTPYLLLNSPSNSHCSYIASRVLTIASSSLVRSCGRNALTRNVCTQLSLHCFRTQNSVHICH